MEYKHTNSLIKSTSPYLLQHAHNPVNWEQWDKSILKKAQQENKLLLISVGYSACHWCHVMEHESFEDEAVAKIMNDYFICIKVDREERPDIDHIYMTAVQLMTGHGGWPLNCFAMPDGRPIYGGTYFPKQQWVNVLLNLVDLQKNEPEKMEDYANQLTQGIKKAELIDVSNSDNELDINIIYKCYENWKLNFDTTEGGPNRAPKFPLPNNYQFLLRLSQTPSPFQGDNWSQLISQINLTLTKMAYGGIYDQIGGGFARYSVDGIWKVPHFEKMLYDNAQLVSLYTEAYSVTQNPLYKQIVFETLAFVEREFLSPEGGFYSALDADSEGAEGKYYIWTKEELQSILKGNFVVFADYYSVNDKGYWEDDNYILLRSEDEIIIANRHNISLEALEKIINEAKSLLISVREKRVKPGLDNKILVSWNALMAKAFIDAACAFDNKHFLETAKNNIEFILSNALSKDYKLIHSLSLKNQQGFLEDYAFLIETLITFYQTTFEEKYLTKANSLMEYCIKYFQDKKTQLFYFTSEKDTPLITRKMELSDNVIPASNSSIAKSLFYLGHYFEKPHFIEQSKSMLKYVLKGIEEYGSGYSNWGILFLHHTTPFSEIAIVGKDVEEKRKEFNKYFLPNVIFAGSKSESDLPLLKNRFKEGETIIYVCSNNTCKEPVKTFNEALKQLQN